jgi:predicted Zn-dependent protease
VAALIAQAEKRNDVAVKEWEEAYRLAPQEKGYQLQLGAAKLRTNDPVYKDAARGLLNALRSDPKFRVPATRILLSEAIAQRESVSNIIELARALNNYPEATFSDAVLLADVLRQTNEREFATYLIELEKRAAARTQDLVTLLFWMNQTNLNLLAADFIKTVKPELLQAWPAPMAIADVHVRLQDWAKLEAALKGADWRNYDFMRHAYLARAFRGQDKPVQAEREWSLAIKGAAIGSEQILMLLRATAAWGWKSEETELLWALTKYPEQEKEALQTLYAHYQKNQDSHGLYRILLRLAEDNAENTDIQNNLAQISLLLDVKTEDARRLAAEVYRKSPNNSAYATTYAYSLVTKGDFHGAVAVMNSLTADQLKDPAVSAYYGICLAALKDPRAESFLKAGERAKLLPEERSLLEKARTSIAANTVP